MGYIVSLRRPENQLIYKTIRFSRRYTGSRKFLLIIDPANDECDAYKEK